MSEISVLNGYKIKDKKAKRFYDNVESMKADTTLKNGMLVETKGYYEPHDGGSAIYEIINDDTAIEDKGLIHNLSNGLYAKLIIKDLVNVAQFGIKGDGVFDDSIAIQNAINVAESYIQEKESPVSSSGNGKTVILPAKKLYIKSTIEIHNNITLEGSGTTTTLILNDNIDYMIKWYKTENSKGLNEEGHIEGGLLKNIRFDGNKRLYTCISAINLTAIDHMTIDNLYFYGIKGKCIEMKAFRENSINNIYTRFCGTYGVGNIDIIENVGGDTSNLNFGNNWNIIFPFGNAIKFVKGEFASINNLVIHGMFTGIINSLTNYFRENEYIDENNNFIELDNSNILLNNCSGIYAPDKSSYINAVHSNIQLINNHYGAHKSTQESHNGDGKFIILSDNSILKSYSGNYLTCAYQEADLIVSDDTSKVYGHFAYSESKATWINADIEDYRRASQFVFDGERDKPVELGFDNYRCVKTYGDDIKAFMSFKAMNNVFEGLTQPDLLYFGVNKYQQKGVVGIPDNNYLRLSTVSGGSSNISNIIYIDENGNLVYKWKNPTTGEYITKTVVTQ